MAKLSTASSNMVSVSKKTSQGGRKSQIKLSSMNKHKKRAYKPSRGQGT